MGKGMRAGKRNKPSAGNMQKQLKQMQAMQREMEEAQDKLGEKEVEATAGGGAVSAKVNGNKELVSLKLDKDVIDPEDSEMLEDLIIAAVNEAMRQVDEMVNDEMGKITGGFGIPGL
ncbi:YbaB/EbfC family nucleoid-associated protein [Alterileibacterium massiliense]|uniref:YbaB/EbfC family nucleoid-associated protein n=1 Tax=Alterileibacterium massiliense TaxID=1870997 RepID=UPI0009F4251D|nr:YbaB/EbfC family nucleoid-associated protein [Alterileibacterium massiliense]